MSAQKDYWGMLETWSDVRLAAEIDQAMAAAKDENNTAEYRDAAFWAAAMMATVLNDRKNPE